MSDLHEYARQVVLDYLTDELEFSRVYEDDDIIEEGLDDDELLEIHTLAQGYLNTVAQWFLEDFNEV